MIVPPVNLLLPYSDEWPKKALSDRKYCPCKHQNKGNVLFSTCLSWGLARGSPGIELLTCSWFLLSFSPPEGTLRSTGDVRRERKRISSPALSFRSLVAITIVPASATDTSHVSALGELQEQHYVVYVIFPGPHLRGEVMTSCCTSDCVVLCLCP